MPDTDDQEDELKRLQRRLQELNDETARLDLHLEKLEQESDRLDAQKRAALGSRHLLDTHPKGTEK